MVYFQPLDTLSNSNSNLRAFTIDEYEWERLIEIEVMLKVSYKFKKIKSNYFYI